ncbi:MAG: efflux RND transporter permease subunit, partial [Betaproteobacteria bacterium]|nr:efflux RND transporter permease subunit [Betaproteobacteria bacterium]
ASDVYKRQEFDRRFVVSGSPTVTQGIGFLRMVDWQDRKRGTAEILKELQPKLLSIPGVLAFAVAPPSLGQSPRVRPINFVVLTSEPYDKLQATVAPFVAELQRHPGLQGVDIDLKLNKPEIKLEIDRQRAADAGVQVEAIGRALETMLGGRQVTRFKRDGEQYDVMVQLDASDRVSPRNIADIYVRGRGDTMVPLASLVSVRESVAPRELNHFAQRRAVTITANLAPLQNLSTGLSSTLGVSVYSAIQQSITDTIINDMRNMYSAYDGTLATALRKLRDQMIADDYKFQAVGTSSVTYTATSGNQGTGTVLVRAYRPASSSLYLQEMYNETIRMNCTVG